MVRTLRPVTLAFFYRVVKLRACDVIIHPLQACYDGKPTLWTISRLSPCRMVLNAFVLAYSVEVHTQPSFGIVASRLEVDRILNAYTTRRTCPSDDYFTPWLRSTRISVVTILCAVVLLIPCFAAIVRTDAPLPAIRFIAVMVFICSGTS